MQLQYNNEFIQINDLSKKYVSFSRNAYDLDIEIFSDIRYNYNEFLNDCALTNGISIDRVYYSFMTEDYLIIVCRENDKKPFVIQSIYKYENSYIKDMLKKILNPDAHGATVFFATKSNNWNFITRKEILVLFFEHAMVLSLGETPFRKFKLKAKSGKIRDIIAPHARIKAPLRALNENLQNTYDNRNSNFQVAYKRGKSIKDNASIHINSKHIYNIDLKDFYPSCKRPLVRKYVKYLFIDAPNSEAMCEYFLDIILDNDGLFIGSPISGCLANVIISKPVKYMQSICEKSGMLFSVYADDMTFSSDKFIVKEFVIEIFNKAFKEYKLDEYFHLKMEKCTGASKNRRRITGVSINGDNELTVKRNYYRTLRVKLHKLSLGETNINIERLRGQIAFAVMLDTSGKMLKLLEKFRSTVDQYRLCSSEKIEELKGF